MNRSKPVEVLKVRFQKVKAIVLSMHDEAEYISRLILDGACAYVPKREDFEEVVRAINKVHQEGYYFSRLISRIIMSSSSAVDSVVKELELSPREIDVLKLICAEKENREIALLLNLSINTITSYRQDILRKTNSASVLGLYKYALRKGIVEAEG